MKRAQCITVKIESKLAPHYLHIEHRDGRVLGISISSPGRYTGSEVGDLLRAIADAANVVITDIAKGGA